MANQSFVFTDDELQYLRQSVLLQLATIRRARAKHITGSALFDAHNKELNSVQAILTKLGG